MKKCPVKTEAHCFFSDLFIDARGPVIPDLDYLTPLCRTVVHPQRSGELQVAYFPASAGDDTDFRQGWMGKLILRNEDEGSSNR